MFERLKIYASIERKAFDTLDEEGCAWLELMKAGKYLYRGKPLTIAESDLDEMIASWTTGRDILPGGFLMGNYDHLPKDEEARGKSDLTVISCGKCVDLKMSINDAGQRRILGRFKPTPKARQQVLDEELNFVSPEFFLGNHFNPSTGEKRKGAAIVGFALTNYPVLTDIESIAKTNNFSQEQGTMNEKELLAKLGLNFETTEDAKAYLASQNRKLDEAKAEAEKVKAQQEEARKGTLILFGEIFSKALGCKAVEKSEEEMYKADFVKADGSVNHATRSSLEKLIKLSGGASTATSAATTATREDAHPGGEFKVDLKDPLCFSRCVSHVGKRDKMTSIAEAIEKAKGEYPDAYRASTDMLIRNAQGEV